MKVDPERLLAFFFAPSAERMQRVAPPDDDGWIELLHTCETLGTSGLAHAALRRTRTTELAPRPVRDALRRAHATAAAHNLALEAEARRVLSALRAAGVVAAPMKGAALFIEGVVDDLGARPTGDFDVVTRREDRDAVLATLERLGYAPRHQELSWKHLPAMWRGDLSIEVHEIAYWSAATRATHGARDLAHADRATRLGHLCALQIHHLVLGSPPDAGLAVRTLGDVAAFLALAEREPRVRDAIVRAARDAGLERELAGCDGIVATARVAQPTLGLAASAADMGALLAPLEDPTPRDPRVDALAHALRIVPIQPWRVTWEMVALLAFPPAHQIEARMGRGPGLKRLSLARVRRPFELAVRVVRALPRALRARPAPRRTTP